MNRISSLFFLLCISLWPLLLNAQTPQNDENMRWFGDAKLGIFIHWGIYSVNGIDESWSFFNGYISHEDYMKQLDGFTATNYQPDKWAELIKESGARYAVITTMHHDGVALWDSKVNPLNVKTKTPAGRDLIKPFVKALRKNKLKVGLYYSLLNWSHPDYPNFTRTQKRFEKDTVKWNRFVKFNFDQLEDLSKTYKPDLYWFDGDWEQSAEAWKAKLLRKKLKGWNPRIILNSRLQGYGDYATPEQGLPVSRPQSPYWELCMTINDSWGYQPNDTNYKSANQIIRIFVDCISMGGNLLLDIGPKPDGSIPQEQVEVLKELGRWTKKHKSAIFGTRAGIPHGHYYGPTALNAEKNILYLYLPHKPNGPIVVKGLKNKVNRIWVVGTGTRLNHKIVGKAYWSEVPGLMYIDVPEYTLDPEVTVIAILLDGPIDLYRETGNSIESN